MDNLKLRDNLNLLMKLHGNLRVNELARLARVPQPTLHHISKGKTKNPRRKSLEALACHFSVSVNQLLGIEPLPRIVPSDIQSQLAIRYIPLVTWSEMAKWPGYKMPQYKVNESRGSRQVIADISINEHAFAVIMEEFLKPIFLKDAVVIFDPEILPVHGDYLLAYLSQLKKVQLVRLNVDGSKRYVKCCRSEEAICLNPYKDKIIARVVETRIPFE